jgi:hypothetical protein
MPTHSNRSPPFEAIRLSLQAREILDRLIATGGVGNDGVFYRWLSTIGLPIASRPFAELLDRLEREALVTSEMVERTRVLRLTRRGQEVARGLEEIESIAPPDPSD